MLNQRLLKCWRFTNRADYSDGCVAAEMATSAIYNQNYIILKQLLNLQEQNQEIIDLLKQLAIQNQQPMQTSNKDQRKNIAQSTLDELQKLEELVSLNILTQEEFDKKKKELLDLEKQKTPF